MNELATYDPKSLTIDIIKNQLIKKGDQKPSDQECLKFIALCKAHNLNPFVNDAYIFMSGGKATIIASISALEKRASSSPQFDGCTHGIIVKRGKDIVYQDGSFKLKDDVILGGWAKAYRKDQAHTQLTTVSLEEYRGGSPIWRQKTGVMIEKCAEAQALRKAFVNETRGMYTSEEMNVDEPKEVEYVVEPVKTIAPAEIEPEDVKPERDPALEPIRALIKPFAAASKLSIPDAINMICSAQNVKGMDELNGKMIKETVEYMNSTIEAANETELAANDIEF